MKTVKSLRIALPLALLSFSTLAFGQSAQASFDQIKSLAGTWEGTLTTVPAASPAPTMENTSRSACG